MEALVALKWPLAVWGSAREREREKENKVRMRKKKEVSCVLTFYFNIIDGKFVDNDLMK